MVKSIMPFFERMNRILSGGLLSVHLYGSCQMDDFQPGWSDIDVLCLTKSPITEEAANALLMLRQQMVHETGNPLFRSIEGAVLPLDHFETNQPTNIVYYGTSGQQIQQHYTLDAFSFFSLHHFGQCIFGIDCASRLPSPAFSDLVQKMHQHLTTIRIHARQTGDSLYSCGWLLDIARCLYTLRYKTIISKTAAGKWALEQHLCPEPIQMERTLAVRQNPSEALKCPETRAWLQSLGPSIQKFADVLEEEMKKMDPSLVFIKFPF